MLEVPMTCTENKHVYDWKSKKKVYICHFGVVPEEGQPEPHYQGDFDLVSKTSLPYQIGEKYTFRITDAANIVGVKEMPSFSAPGGKA